VTPRKQDHRLDAIDHRILDVLQQDADHSNQAAYSGAS